MAVLFFSIVKEIRKYPFRFSTCKLSLYPMTI